ncbi:hypothetical protein C2S52_007546 [Perilla frutescens var. hirtella]|nr:hypothetical protein C2S51_008337 [Perilla frutescens var. frutescens]KAH6787994.1 hypothetical protein C2S52_007546 [Perilla frutescens var. hirtella]
MKSHLSNINIILNMCEFGVVSGVDVEFHDGVAGDTIVRIGGLECVSTSKSESAGPTRHRQLPLRVHNLVSPQNADCAAVEPPRREVYVDVQRHGVHRQVSRSGQPLDSADGRRVDAGVRRDQAVDDVYAAEAGWRVRGDGSCCNRVDGGVLTANS